MQETWLPSLGGGDPLKKGIFYSSILAWKLRLTEKPVGLQSMGSQTVGHDWVANTQQRTLQWINVLSWIWWILPDTHLWPTLGLPFPCGSAGKESPAMQETWIRSLGWKDPVEKGMATHSSILAWRIPRTATVHGVEKSRAGLSEFHFIKKKKKPQKLLMEEEF